MYICYQDTSNTNYPRIFISKNTFNGDKLYTTNYYDAEVYKTIGDAMRSCIEENKKNEHKFQVLNID